MRSRLLAPLFVVALAGCGGGGGSHKAGASSGGTVTFDANSIVYGVANGTDLDFSVNEIAPAGGTPKTVVTSVDGSILAFALDPSRAGRYVLAADPTGSGTVGLYLSKNLSLTGATTLVAPAYVSIGSLAITAGGSKVVYAAASASGESDLYVVPTAGGTPVVQGAAEVAAVSPTDGDTVVFTALDSASGGISLYRRNLSDDPSVSSQTIVSSAGDSAIALPTFSPDGTKIAYWTLGGASTNLTVLPLGGASGVTIPGVAGIEPQGMAFSPEGATLSFVGQSGTGGIIATVPAGGSASPTTIVTDANLLGNYGFFWTDANGRAASGARSVSTASRAKKRGSA